MGPSRLILELLTPWCHTLAKLSDLPATFTIISVSSKAHSKSHCESYLYVQKYSFNSPVNFPEMCITIRRYLAAASLYYLIRAQD